VPGDALDEAVLARARAGDEEAFRQLTEPHRRELQVHCYRILGSMQDAEDLVQETLLAAWRSLEGFEGRASVRSWLYRIATNRCLNALRARSRRPREVPAMGDSPEPTRRTEPVWLEPYPDVLLEEIPDRSPGRRWATRWASGLADLQVFCESRRGDSNPGPLLTMESSGRAPAVTQSGLPSGTQPNHRLPRRRSRCGSMWADTDRFGPKRMFWGHLPYRAKTA
jgi:RNA polymerase sigma factor (sigma-70 family)